MDYTELVRIGKCNVTIASTLNRTCLKIAIKSQCNYQRTNQASVYENKLKSPLIATVKRN